MLITPFSYVCQAHVKSTVKCWPFCFFVSQLWIARHFIVCASEHNHSIVSCWVSKMSSSSEDNQRRKWSMERPQESADSDSEGSEGDGKASAPRTCLRSPQVRRRSSAERNGSDSSPQKECETRSELEGTPRRQVRARHRSPEEFSGSEASPQKEQASTSEHDESYTDTPRRQVRARHRSSIPQSPSSSPRQQKASSGSESDGSHHAATRRQDPVVLRTSHGRTMLFFRGYLYVKDKAVS